MSLPNTKVESVWFALTSRMVMPPRMPTVLAGVVMTIGPLLLILPQHALAGVDRELAGLGVGIEHELVDGELGVGPDRQRRAVEEQQMRAVVGAGGDELVGLHVDADAQHALGLLRRLAERIAVGRRGDTDLRCRIADGHWCCQQAKRCCSENCDTHSSNPNTFRLCHEFLRRRHGGP
jgi:hypothetical protein